LDATKGIVFFATPHFGVNLAHRFSDKKYAEVIGQINSIVGDLADLKYLYKLHDDYASVSSHISTLSIGEGMTYFDSRNLTGTQIVPDESSNPKFIGKNHKFIKTDRNHRQVCKPENLEDFRYVVVRDFISEVLGNSQDST